MDWRGSDGGAERSLAMAAFSTLSIVRYSENPDNTTFRKEDLLPSSSDGAGRLLLYWAPEKELPSSLVTQVNFFSATQQNRSLPAPSPEDGKSLVSETLCCLGFTMDNVQKPSDFESCNLLRLLTSSPPPTFFAFLCPHASVVFLGKFLIWSSCM
jgi:hypothetical protein